MSTLVLSYDDLNNAAKDAGQTAKALEDYADRIEKKVCRKIMDYSGGLTQNMSDADGFMRKKLEKLSQKKVDYETLSSNLRTLEENCKTADQNVANGIHTLSADFKNQYQIKDSLITKMFNYLGTKLNGAAFGRYLKDITLTVVDIVKAGAEKVKDWYKYEGGKSLLDAAWKIYVNAAQFVLDLVGLIPVIGEPCDAASGLISLLRGDRAGAVLSLGSCIPFLGDVSGAGKVVRRGLEFVDTIRDSVKILAGIQAKIAGLGIVKFLVKKSDNVAEVVNTVEKEEEIGETVIKTSKYSETEIENILNNLKGDGYKNNPLRQAYENEVADLKVYGDELLSSGMSEEKVAQTLNQARRDLGIKYKDATPQPLRDYIYEVNIGRYGDELGPNYDYLIKVKKKSNRDIINSSSRPNSNIDSLLSGFEEWLRRQ